MSDPGRPDDRGVELEMGGTGAQHCAIGGWSCVASPGSSGRREENPLSARRRTRRSYGEKAFVGSGFGQADDSKRGACTPAPRASFLPSQADRSRGLQHGPNVDRTTWFNVIPLRRMHHTADREVRLLGSPCQGRASARGAPSGQRAASSFTKISNTPPRRARSAARESPLQKTPAGAAATGASERW